MTLSFPSFTFHLQSLVPTRCDRFANTINRCRSSLRSRCYSFRQPAVQCALSSSPGAKLPKFYKLYNGLSQELCELRRNRQSCATMLLPSAIDCVPFLYSPRSSHMHTATMLSPPPTYHSPTSPTSNIYGACRSLQSLITTKIPATTSSISKPSRAPPQLASPITFTSPKQARSHSKKSRKIATPQTPPRPSRKRRRSLSDDEGPSDKENISTSNPSTPKRQRLYPPSLPLGLERADFDALQEQAAKIPIPVTPENRKKEDSPDEAAESEWCSSDDSALVSIILRKLQLRQSDWDECAQRLGKGKDSIGERWKLLVGEGEVGLRRGSRAQRRGNVQRMVFGSPLVRP